MTDEKKFLETKQFFDRKKWKLIFNVSTVFRKKRKDFNVNIAIFSFLGGHLKINFKHA
jgi:hypothetical protein